MLVNLLSKVVKAGYSKPGSTAIKAAKITTKVVVVVAINVFAHLDENYSHSNSAEPF